MKKLTMGSFFLTLAVSCLLLVVPTYFGQREEFHTSGATTHTHIHASLLQVNGPRVLTALMIPVLIALMPMLFPKRGVRIAAAVALAFFVLITGFSIGLFYLPSAVTLTVASVLSSQPRKV